MFHYDNGLKLTAIDLAVDYKRRQPRGFISHAHADHIARHELVLCTPATARLCEHRMGKRQVVPMHYHQPLEWGPTRLTALPAGHVLGSAMLLAEHDDERLLYTGDFKLGPSATAEPAELPQADVLVMECTFGDPRYCLPPREEVIGQLLNLVRRSLAADVTPVIHAYVLGKAQEVTRLLTDAGIPVQQHPLIHAVTRIYESLGCTMGQVLCYDGRIEPGHALVMPPSHMRKAWLPMPARRTRIAVTGWAQDARTRFRLGVDHALPLSDHADYNELLECVERVQPRVVYCTHGPASFADRLVDAGWEACCLGSARQLRLFR